MVVELGKWFWKASISKTWCSSGAKETSMDGFLLAAIFDVEGFDVDSLAVCARVTINVESTVDSQ